MAYLRRIDELRASRPWRIRLGRSTLLCAAAAMALLLTVKAEAQIEPVVVDGHKVYVNEDDQPKYVTAQGTPSRYSKSLIFWSNTEHRWKAVPHANPAALDAARTAANEVKEFVSLQPAASTAGKEPAEKDPNFAKMAKGYAVTTAEVEKAVEEAAARHGVDAGLVKAIIKVESNFNARVISNKGAMGLMQLMPDTARRLNVNNPFDVNENVDAGVRHFRKLLDDFNGDVKLSLAAYNAGEKAVTSHGGIPPYHETQNYVRQITNLYNGGLSLQFTPTRAPIKVYRDESGVLTFNNVD
ncbi:MAG TPA: lytic transglycosylase domain-containing protein [Candidatus Koribacter sp.]|jgi:soluble lytic murein transglycosylase-like protein